MPKSLPIIALSLLAGIAVAAAYHGFFADSGASRVDGQQHFDASAATEERLLALERALSEERNARQLLEDELTLLFEEIERLESASAAGQVARPAEPLAVGRSSEAPTASTRAMALQRREAMRQQALVDAGLSEDRASWILRRESELRFEAMQVRFEARNSDDPSAMSNPRLNPDQMLRAEIGDTEYEYYLQANNRPTAVTVSRVLASSVGEQVGIQPGDRIVSYDGERIFSTFELMQHTMGGEAGGNVIVDVIRDGAPLQMVLPRGPIGIESRGSRRR